MREFQFKKSYEEVKINGDVYQIDMSDVKVAEYQILFSTFHDEAAKLQAESEKDMTPDEQKAFINKSKELVGKALEALLGENTFDKLYEQSGKSIINVIDLILFLAEMIAEKTEKVKDENIKKYLKAKKKK